MLIHLSLLKSEANIPNIFPYRISTTKYEPLITMKNLLRFMEVTLLNVIHRYAILRSCLTISIIEPTKIDES